MRPLVLARQRKKQFTLAIARYAGQAHHFARAHLQRHIGQIHPERRSALQVEVCHLQHRVARRARAVLQRGRIGADHQARQRGVALGARIGHARHLAAPHHGAGVAQGANLVQLVADVQDAAPLGRQLAQGDEQLFDRLRRQHRSGLVQDQQARLGQQGANDLYPLHLAHAQGVHGAFGVDVQPVGGGGFANALADLLQRQRTVQPQPHVFGHAQGFKQAEVLKHHGNAQLARFLRATDVGGPAVKAHFARVGLHRAVDDLHQRAFAGAVFAQHGVNLARQHRQRHRIVGQHTGVALGDARQFQAWRRARGGSGFVGVIGV